MTWLEQITRPSAVRLALGTSAILLHVLYILLVYDGRCIMPGIDNLAGMLIAGTFYWRLTPLLFLIGFVWVTAQSLRIATSSLGMSQPGSVVLGAGMAAIVYGAIVLAFWQQSPIPENFYAHEQRAGRIFGSVYWPIGILVLDGRTSGFTCGQ